MKSIFISSTFRDMQAERDLLHRVVFPGLRGRLARQGEDIQEMDLRWGVDTSDLSEESSNIMVMKTCIDAIDRCLPYMVVFLGERYGWIPEHSMVEETHDSRLAALEGEAISITQMEILYGALEDGRHLEKCVFCFRDEHFTENMPEDERRDYEAESEVHRSKLQLLKKRIRQTPGAKILEYTPVWDEAAHRVSGLEDLAARLGECLWEMIREEDEEEGREPREEQILKNARLTAERYLKSYIDIEKPDGSTFKRRNYGVFLVGEGGSGKSAMGTRITDYCERMGDHVFRYYCGNEGCADIDTFLDVLLYWEAKDHGSEPGNPAREPMASGAGSTEEKQILLWERLREKTAYDRVFFIDGAEEMPAGFLKVIQGLANALSSQFGHRMLLVTSRPESVRYLRAAAEKAGEQEKEIFDFTDLDWLHKTYPIGEKGIRAIADRHAALRGKQLDSMVLEQICHHPLSGNFYALTMILQRLFMMDKDDFARADQLAPGMEGLSLYMRQIVRELPADQGGLTACVVRRAAEQLAHGGGTFALEGRKLADAQEVLMLLAASREGLSVSELNGILETENAFYPPLLLEQLFCYLYDCFSEEESGRWDFRHRFLRESVLRSEGRTELKKTYRKLLFFYQTDLSGREHPGEEFYYIWRCGDVPAAVSFLERTAGRQPDDVLRTVFFQMLREAQERGDEFLRTLYPELTLGAQETVNRILLNSGEELFAHVWVLRGYYREQNVGKTGTPQQRLLQLLVALKLKEMEVEVREENQILWKRLVQTFFECDAPEPRILREIYETMLFQTFFGDMVFITGESRKLCESLGKMLRDAGSAAMAKNTERFFAWGERRTRLAQETSGGQRPEALKACENMLREWKDTCDPKLYHMALYQMAGFYGNARKYAAAAPLYREVIRFAEEGFGATRSLFYGRLRMLAEADLAGCLKKEFRQDHYLRAQKTAEELAVLFSSPFTQYYLAAMCDVMYFSEKQTPKESANERIARWERAGDYLAEGFGALDRAAEHMRQEELPVCLTDRKLLLLEDRVEWQEQMGSWTAGQNMKEDFESIRSGCEELFARTKDERYRQRQLAGIASALEYYGRWRDSAEVCLWIGRLREIIGTDGEITEDKDEKTETSKEKIVNEGQRYQALLCRLLAAESMLRCGNVEECESLSAACRKDERLLADWPSLGKRQEEWERLQIRLQLLEGEIACRREEPDEVKGKNTESQGETGEPKEENAESHGELGEPKEEKAAPWLPVALQAYRRAEELCEQTVRQIEEEKERKAFAGSGRRNTLIIEQFGLWIRAALLLADGYRRMGEAEQEESCLARVKDADLFLAEPGSSERISLTELGERGIWLRLEYARLAMRREDARALSMLSSIGEKQIPDCDLRLWPEMYDMALKLMRMYGKPGYGGWQKQRLALLLLRTLWEQAGSGQATDEEKQLLVCVLACGYRDDDKGYDIPLATYTSKRYDREKQMKDIRKIPGPFPWPNSFICNREWHENVFHYTEQYGRPEDCCLAAMRLAVCCGLDGDYAKAYELCRVAGGEKSEKAVETGKNVTAGENGETGEIPEQYLKLGRCWEILWELLAKRVWELPETEKWRETWKEAQRIREDLRQWMKKEEITFDTAMDMVLYATGTYLQCDIEWEKLHNFLKNLSEKPARFWLDRKSCPKKLAFLLRVPAEKMLETNRIRLDQASTREERTQRQRDLRISCNVLRYLWACETEEATGMNEWQRGGEIYRYKRMAAELTWKIEGSRYGIREKINALYQYLGAAEPVSGEAAAEDVKRLLPDYQELVRLRAQSDAAEWKDMYGLRSDWNYLSRAAEKMFLYLYEQEQDVQWLRMLLEEYQEMNRCLSEKATEDWKAEYITYNCTDIRHVWLKLARHLPEEEWAKPYLKTVEDQLAHIGKNRRMLASMIGELSGNLNMELRGLKLETPALQTELRTLVAAMPALLSGAGNDISYIMMKALEELGPDASEDQVRQYVEARM